MLLLWTVPSTCSSCGLVSVLVPMKDSYTLDDSRLVGCSATAMDVSITCSCCGLVPALLPMKDSYTLDDSRLVGCSATAVDIFIHLLLLWAGSSTDAHEGLVYAE